MKEVLIPIGSNLEIPDYTRDNLIWDFKLKFRGELYKYAPNTPIIWKTTPSRKNSNIGQYMVVEIEENSLPSHNRGNDNESQTIPQSNPERKKRDNFWQKYSISFKSDSGSFSLNIRHFIIHYMIYKQFGDLNIGYYDSGHADIILDSELFQDLDALKWFSNKTKEFKSVCKAAKQNCGEFNKRSKILSKCQEMRLEQSYDTTTLHNISDEDLIKVLFSYASRNIIYYMIQIKNRT